MPRVLMRVAAMVGLCLLLAGGCREKRERIPDELTRARHAYSQGLYLESEAEFERFLQEYAHHPARWEAWNRLLDIAVSIKSDSEKGLLLLEAMLLEYGDDKDKAADLLLQIGDYYADHKNWEKAIEKWHRGRRLSSLPPEKQFPFSLRMARSYRAMGYYDMAREVLVRCLREAPDARSLAAVKYDLAMTFTFLENWDKAREFLEEVVPAGDLPPEDRAVAGFLLAEVHIHEGRLQQARELLESILKEHPNPLTVEIKAEHLKKAIAIEKGRPKPVIEPME